MMGCEVNWSSESSLRLWFLKERKKGIEEAIKMILNIQSCK